MDEPLYTTPPSPEGRQPREMRVYALLERLGVPYVRLDHEETPSIEACHDVDRLLGVEISKNLFLCNAAKTVYCLLVLPGTKPFRTKDLSRQIGSSRLSFGSPGAMLELLDLAPGSVSVLGLMNDRENRVKLLIDRDVLKQEYIGCHPCVNTASLRIRTADLLDKVLPALGREATVVDL